MRMRCPATLLNTALILFPSCQTVEQAAPANDTVTFTEPMPMPMNGYLSSTLDKTFECVYFTDVMCSRRSFVCRP